MSNLTTRNSTPSINPSMPLPGIFHHLASDLSLDIVEHIEDNLERLTSQELQEEALGKIPSLISYYSKLKSILIALKDTEKNSSKAFSLQTHFFSFEAWIKQIKQDWADALQAGDLVLTFSPDIPSQLGGSQLALNRLLHGLIARALKLRKNGPVQVHISQDYLFSNEDVSRLEIMIFDASGWTPTSEAREFFDFNVNANQSLETKLQHIQLFISHEIARSIALEFNSESIANRGTRIKLQIKLLRNNVQSSLPLQGLHILVADDDILSRTVAKGLLEHLGAQLTIAEDGLAALTLCQNNMFHAIIIDQSMPKLEGFACAKEIRKLPAYGHVPTYLSTATQIQELPDFIAGLLPKPISAAAVLRLFTWHTDKASLTDREAQRPRENLELAAALTPGHTWLDHDHIIKNFGQVPALLGQCIPLVKSRYPILLENLNMALTLRHWPNLQAAAHELRGMLANLSCNKLADIAAKIEESCHSLAIELSSVCILHLEQSIPVFIEELESIVKATSNHPEQSSTSH